MSYYKLCGKEEKLHQPWSDTVQPRCNQKINSGGSDLGSSRKRGPAEPYEV